MGKLKMGIIQVRSKAERIAQAKEQKRKKLEEKRLKAKQQKMLRDEEERKKQLKEKEEQEQWGALPLEGDPSEDEESIEPSTNCKSDAKEYSEFFEFSSLPLF